MSQQAQLELIEKINPNMLCDPDYMVAAMLPIFGRAMGKYATQMVDPKAWVKRGMKDVFDWWCKHGVGCGEPELIDAAADVAWMVAAQVYPEPDTLTAAFDDLLPYMLEQLGKCQGYRPSTPGPGSSAFQAYP